MFLAKQTERTIQRQAKGREGENLYQVISQGKSSLPLTHIMFLLALRIRPPTLYTTLYTNPALNKDCSCYVSRGVEKKDMKNLVTFTEGSRKIIL